MNRFFIEISQITVSFLLVSNAGFYLLNQTHRENETVYQSFVYIFNLGLIHKKTLGTLCDTEEVPGFPEKMSLLEMCPYPGTLGLSQF